LGDRGDGVGGPRGRGPPADRAGRARRVAGADPLRGPAPRRARHRRPGGEGARVDRPGASAAFDEIAAALPEPVRSISLRAWPLDFPEDIAVQRRVPYEARADAIMYRQELAELAHARHWEVHLYDAKAVLGQAARMLGERGDDMLHRPRATLGPPWTNDHRTALAATIVAGGSA
jgi:hypothetical protein